MTIKGFVFDFDGLILDTEVPLYNAWQEAFTQFGFSLSMSDWWKIIGTGGNEYDPAQDLFQKTQGKIVIDQVKRKVIERSDQLIDIQPLQPGVEEFIQQAYQQGLRMAVASSSSYDWVFPFLEKYSLAKYFDAIYTASDVEFVKPNPALYTLAIKKLGLAPNAVIAFEDSLNGVLAAKAAGLYCVAIPNQITQEMDLSIADRIVDSFINLSIEDLCLNKQ